MKSQQKSKRNYRVIIVIATDRDMRGPGRNRRFLASLWLGMALSNSVDLPCGESHVMFPVVFGTFKIERDGDIISHIERIQLIRVILD